MKKILFLIAIVLVIIMVYNTSEENVFIPDSSVRLRVIPNSNNPEDIYMKEKVKKYLEKNVYNLTADVTDIESARTIIKNNIPQITSDIDTIFINNKYLQTYDVNYGNNYFPEKEYKGIIYKAGYYESLVISIGDAKGDNWWCVMFPNFCLIDTREKPEYRSYFKEIFTKYSKNK